MTADTRRVFAYSFPYLTPFYNVPMSFGNRNAGKVFIWQSKRNASSRTRLKAYPYKGNTSCDLFRTVGEGASFATQAFSDPQVCFAQLTHAGDPKFSMKQLSPVRLCFRQREGHYAKFKESAGQLK
ncbi:hypothetical protein NDU88_004278 [Pleurodeles waltl]|uniref:Uncharacterized protein n=1 Tax=Pleurodeles waltl TaxID=8319 RepID=A0AAV7WVE9_PLEWA|nr:hypothetical protein NDU88_004278 [Pleurodeles waltl]